MFLSLTAALCMLQPAIEAPVPLHKGGFVFDSHPVPFKLGPSIPTHLRSKDWVYVDFAHKIAWQFHGKKVCWACRVSVAGKGHRQLKGWNRIRYVKYLPTWYPTKNTHRMLKKRKEDVPAIVPGGSPLNALGLWKWAFDGPYAGHGNNCPSCIGGCTCGCIQFGNADIDRMTRTGVGEGDYVYVQT